MMHLSSPVRDLAGVGAQAEKCLFLLGIRTLRDLIFYFPFRFDDYSAKVKIKDLLPNTSATIQGKIVLIANRRSPRQKKVLTEALVSDESGTVKVIWFNQPFLLKSLSQGDTVSLAGKIQDHPFDLQMMSPQFEKVLQGKETIHTARLVPVYSLTESITQKQLRTWIKSALAACVAQVSETLPEEILAQEKLLGIKDALQQIHFPKNQEEWEYAKKRFQFDELFQLQLFSLTVRRSLKSILAPAFQFFEEKTRDFVKSLPFRISEAQRRSSWEILQDCQKKTPMNRLLEGDVGSGKTAVAAIAMHAAVVSGYQVAYMAPTEVLAKQHYGTLCSFFENYPFSLCLLSSSECEENRNEPAAQKTAKSKKKKNILERITDGTINIIIGTHALLEEGVRFHLLGLVIIDEQHRFGVHQRKVLREKSGITASMPHLLSLTATPIPRSLALTIYGDLDISLLDELPAGRREIITKIVPAHYRSWTYEFIEKEIKKGRQAIIICPTIDQSDTLGVKSVTQEYERLSREVFPDRRLRMLHGKMRAEKKDEIMREMRAGSADIVVSTSVVEVGVDIPNATVIAIEGAERFGLAQLHQFRGRVGRSTYQSYCFLLPTTEEKEDEERLKALVSSSNGFELAEKDLELRGPGEVFGVRQSGMIELKIANLQDVALIKKTREWARSISENIETYPELLKSMELFEKDMYFE